MGTGNEIYQITLKKIPHQPKAALNIALFGSSFNPPHNGHAAVLRFVASQNIFDEIWLLPVYKHPFAKDLWPYKMRLKLTKLLLTGILHKSFKNKKIPPTKMQSEIKNRQGTSLKICEIEKQLGKNPSYMFDTVRELKKKHPKNTFTLILGSDCKKDLPKWHRYTELKKLIRFYFVPRKGFENSPFPKVSSTQIRTRLKAKKSIIALVPELIAKSILPT